MHQVISESCYKGTILQRNYRKMTILWSFSCYSFVKYCGKKTREPHDCYIQICVMMRCVTVNSETFVRVLIMQNFTIENFCKNKTAAKW